MLKVIVNGSPIEMEEPMSVQNLLKTADVPDNYLAVEVNEDVVPRPQHSDFLVRDGDRVEVVTLVGGG